MSGARIFRVPLPAEGSRRPGLALVGVVLVGYFAISYDNFLAVPNLSAIAQSSSFVLLGSIGTMALLASGNVDLSIGSQFALISVVSAHVGVSTGSAWGASFTALGLGVVLGAINGALVLLLDVSPLIVTLGTFGLYGGLAYATTMGQTVYGLPERLLTFGRSGVLGFRWPVLIALIAFVVGAFVITSTVSGLRLFAVGSNRRAAELVGVPVRAVTVGVFAANGFLIGLAALLSVCQLASGSPSVGVDYALHVLAAVILGGVAFTGGRGHPLGVLVAVVVIGIVDSGLIFAGLRDWWQQVAQGGLLLVALAADQFVVLRRERRIRSGHATSHPGPAPLEEPDVPAPVGPPARGTALEVRDLTVRFSGVTALEGVSLDVGAGEVVCLVGDNGAGKSTLAKALCGAVRPSTGSVRLDGRRLGQNPGAARQAGVEIVFQENALCPNLNVASNLALGREPRRLLAGVIPVRDTAAADVSARRRLATLGVKVADIDRPVRFLSGGERQLVQILRVMRDDVRLVVLDEPTSALGLRQAGEVRRLVRRIARSGVPVLLISHDVEEVFDVADRVIILQRGRVAFDGPIGSLNRIELLQMMSGRSRAQSALILDEVSAERKRIERALHDGAQQGLVTSALLLNMARQKLRNLPEAPDERVLEILDQSADTLQSAMTDMRAFSRGLTSGVLSRDGLVAAVRVLTDRAPLLAQLRAEDIPRLSDGVEQAAYYVLAEGFTNALKYAHATRIVIEVAIVASELVVSVCDDGTGFEEAGTMGSGLRGLRDRVAQADGDLVVHSRPGAGSTITARFPVPDRSAVVVPPGSPS